MTRLGSLMEETILVYGCIKMHALLVWKGLAKALKGRETLPTMMFDEEEDELRESTQY